MCDILSIVISYSNLAGLKDTGYKSFDFNINMFVIKNFNINYTLNWEGV